MYDEIVKDAKTKISDIELKAIDVFSQGESNLASVEFEKNVPWPIQRVFYISSLDKVERGNHAHKECIQAIICLTGEVEILCFDGEEEARILLNGIDKFLIVPSGIWIKLIFAAGTVISVLANQKYDERDYIRNWQDFQIFRSTL